MSDTDTVQSINKTVWQEQKGSGSCSYMRHKNKKKQISTQTQN